MWENSQNSWNASIIKGAETVHELQVNKGEAYEGSARHLSPETREKPQQLPLWHHLPTVYNQYCIVFSPAKHIVMQRVQVAP